MTRFLSRHQIAGLPAGGALRFSCPRGTPYQVVREEDGFSIYRISPLDGLVRLHSYGTVSTVERFAGLVSRPDRPRVIR